MKRRSRLKEMPMRRTSLLRMTYNDCMPFALRSASIGYPRKYWRCLLVFEYICYTVFSIIRYHLDLPHDPRHWIIEPGKIKTNGSKYGLCIELCKSSISSSETEHPVCSITTAMVHHGYTQGFEACDILP